MELVRAASLTGYFAVAEQLGLEVTPLLQRAGLARHMLANPEQMIPARSAIRLLEDSAQASGCMTFGLRMAELRQLSDIGMISLLIVHQPTLHEALQVLGEYSNRINSNLSIQVEDHGETFFLPGEEIIPAGKTADVVAALDLTNVEIDRIRRRARERVLDEHTSAHRARQLEGILAEAMRAPAPCRETREAV